MGRVRSPIGKVMGFYIWENKEGKKARETKGLFYSRTENGKGGELIRSEES